MLTAIICSRAGPLALGRTLAPLVHGVVEGLLLEVLIVADPGDGDSGEVARAAGADIVEARDWESGVAAACLRARGPLVLVLDAGVLVGELFWAAVSDRLRAGDTDRVLATRPEEEGVLGALLRRMTGGVSPDQALVMPRALVGGDPWKGRYRGRIGMLQALSLRLRLQEQR